MTSLPAALAAARTHARPAIIGFLPAGYPDAPRFLDAVAAAFAAGATAVEVGIPLSDPTLDGDRIAAAFARAGGTVAQQIDLLEAASERGPTIAMVYAARAALHEALAVIDGIERTGATALLVPDLEMPAQLRLCDAAAIPVGVFVATPAGLEAVAAHAGRQPAFVYLRSSARRTGERLHLDDARRRLTDVRAALARRDLPLLVGFGVSEAAQVGELGRAGADGVVVGTALVEAADRGVAAVRELVRALAGDPIGAAGG